MTFRHLTPALALAALTACAPVQPIIDHDAPLSKLAPVTSPRPEPRPARAVPVPQCEHGKLIRDCDESEPDRPAPPPEKPKPEKPKPEKPKHEKKHHQPKKG